MILDVAFWTDAGRGGPHTSRVSVLVPEASSDEAPVALRYRNPPSGWDKSPEQGEIRLFANRLYRPYATGDRHCAKPVRRTSQWMAIVAARPETANLLGVRNSYHERTEGEHHLQSWASEMLMIDGSPWRPTPEPLLAVEGTPTTHLGWKKAPAPVVKVRDDGGAPNGKLGLPRVHPGELFRVDRMDMADAWSLERFGRPAAARPETTLLMPSLPRHQTREWRLHGKASALVGGMTQGLSHPNPRTESHKAASAALQSALDAFEADLRNGDACGAALFPLIAAAACEDRAHIALYSEHEWPSEWRRQYAEIHDDCEDAIRRCLTGAGESQIDETLLATEFGGFGP